MITTVFVCIKSNQYWEFIQKPQIKAFMNLLMAASIKSSDPTPSEFVEKLEKECTEENRHTLMLIRNPEKVNLKCERCQEQGRNAISGNIGSKITCYHLFITFVSRQV